MRIDVFSRSVAPLRLTGVGGGSIVRGDMAARARHRPVETTMGIGLRTANAKAGRTGLARLAGLGAAALGLALSLGLAAPRAQAANLLELNFWLSGPNYSGNVPACDEQAALGLISAGLVMILPLTETSPASIRRSASRRDATPRRDSSFAIRSPAGGLVFSGMGGDLFAEGKRRGTAPRDFCVVAPEDI